MGNPGNKSLILERRNVSGSLQGFQTQLSRQLEERVGEDLLQCSACDGRDPSIK